MPKKSTDITPYMPAVPANAAALRQSKKMTAIDIADHFLRTNNEAFDALTEHLEECNGHSVTSKNTWFSRHRFAVAFKNLATEHGIELLGALDDEEADRILGYVKNRGGVGQRQRLRIAKENRQRAIVDATTQQEASDVPVAFK